jgi:hypothetical protein
MFKIHNPILSMPIILLNNLKLAKDSWIYLLPGLKSDRNFSGIDGADIAARRLPGKSTGRRWVVIELNDLVRRNFPFE